ncbi:nitroreductase family protein [Paenibacillus sp. 2KB_20]|uniref:nitroreductase family protein n=1 Tax=Paenibacillus sp. 2KB_20 TaxID=3232977 RepID=UPI003F9721BF
MVDAYGMIQAMINENLLLTTEKDRAKTAMDCLGADNYTLGIVDRVKVALPESKNREKQLIEILYTRVSVRQYAEASVQLEDLGMMLRAAEYRDHSDWSCQHELGIKLNYYVIARRVESLLSGQICRYDSTSHSLELMQCLDLKSVSYTLQEEFAHAPAIIIVSGSMSRSVDMLGAHGYRQILVRGGAAVQRISQVAMSLNYVGCIFAGLYQRPLKEYVEIDGYQEVQLLAYALGREK